MNTMDRSTFVSVVGWIFIVISALGTIIAVIENVLTRALGPLVEHVGHAVPPSKASWFVVLVLSHLKLYYAVLLVVCVITLVSSVGLVKRRNWARLAFVSLMGLGVLWNLPAIFVTLVTNKVYIFFPVVLILLFGWIGVRLASPKVAAEFAGER